MAETEPDSDGSRQDAPDRQTPQNSQPSGPITDSPWFWAYLFATGGLIALVLMGPKYDYRQAEIEREFSARQSHGHTLAGDGGPVEPPAAGNQRITLRPLYLLLGFGLAAAWIGFWYQRFHRRRPSMPGRAAPEPR